MTKFRMTPEEHTKAVMEALDKTFQKVNQSKESALAFLKELGVLEEDETEDETNSLKK